MGRIETLVVGGATLIGAGWMLGTVGLSEIWPPEVVWPLSIGALLLTLGTGAVVAARLIDRVERGDE